MTEQTGKLTISIVENSPLLNGENENARRVRCVVSESGGHGDRLRPGGGQEALSRDAVGADGGDARWVAVREPGGIGFPERAALELSRADGSCHDVACMRCPQGDCGFSPDAIPFRRENYTEADP